MMYANTMDIEIDAHSYVSRTNSWTGDDDISTVNGYYSITKETKHIIVQDGGSYFVDVWLKWLADEHISLSFIDHFSSDGIIESDKAKEYALEMVRYTPYLMDKYNITNLPDFSTVEWIEPYRDGVHTMQEHVYIFVALCKALEMASENGILVINT